MNENKTELFSVIALVQWFVILTSKCWFVLDCCVFASSVADDSVIETSSEVVRSWTFQYRITSTYLSCSVLHFSTDIYRDGRKIKNYTSVIISRETDHERQRLLIYTTSIFTLTFIFGTTQIVPSVHRLQMKNRGTKCTFILVVGRPTVAQSSSHTEFLSSIRFSPLRLLRRRKWTKNFLAFSSGHELKLSLSTTKANYSDQNHRIKNSSLARLFRSHRNSHYTRQLAVNFRDDRNLSMHHRELMRFKNSFSLLS